MRHVIRKLFFDFEKEELFLNKMSANGLALSKYTWGKYVFDEAPKGEYIYRLELLEYPMDSVESQNYIQFMEETGAELVATYHRWAYFRKKASEGDFNIYTDIDSRLKHYERIRFLFLVVIGFNIFVGFFNLFLGNLHSTSSYPAINNYVGIFSFSFVTLLLISLLLPLTKKIERLKKEKQIRE